MVIVAHPDDADFGPAATAARWIDQGSVGWLVCCTSGDAGGEDPDTRSARAGRGPRGASSDAAAAVVGYAGVTFLHQPDGALANDLALREQLVREIRTFRPDAVLATDPEVVFYRRRRRQPHRSPGGRAWPRSMRSTRPRATRWRSRGSRSRASMAHKVRRLYLFWPNAPNAHVDVTATIDRKVDGAAGPRQPDQGARRARGADPRVGGGARRGDRGRRRPRVPGDRDRRRRGGRTHGGIRRSSGPGPSHAASARPRAASAGPRPTRSTARPGRRRDGRAARPSRRGSARRPPPTRTRRPRP